MTSAIGTDLKTTATYGSDVRATDPFWSDASAAGSIEMPVSGEVLLPVWPSTLISQYANSPNLIKLISAFGDAIDPRALIDAFYSQIWNINTAVGYGLDVWGRIVGVSRALYVPGGQSGRTLGFDEAGTSAADPFGQSPFYSIPGPTPNYSLIDAPYRQLILIKALSNISNRSITAMNSALMQLFPGRGNCYVGDVGGMQMQLVFQFFLTPIESAILMQSGAFPGPSGVLVTVQTLDAANTLSFAEAGVIGSTFNNGNFNH